MVDKQEIIDFNDYEEVDEGFPTALPGVYAVRVVDEKVRVAKGSGKSYVSYSPVLVASMNEENPGVDKAGLSIRNMRCEFDSFFITPNALKQDGSLRTHEELEKTTREMRGRVKRNVNAIAGEEVALGGSEAEVANQICDAISGATFVAEVGVRGKGIQKRNYILSHEPMNKWEGADF